MRPLSALLLISCLGLGAQDESAPGGNRMGIGLSWLIPAGNLSPTFDTGWQAGLQIHFNRESRHLGRLRIDFLRMESAHAFQTGYYGTWNGSGWTPNPQFSDSRMQGFSVAYEWMPHLEGHSHSGFYGIFGMGGTFWTEQRRLANGSYGGTNSDSDLGFTLSAGAGWRFNTHAAIEARLVNSDLSSTQGHHEYGTSRSYLTFGTSLRF
jgi:hypothetical protein